MQLTSPAFVHQGSIPAKYTCDGLNINPPLQIKNVPPAARSLILIMDDPDAPSGTFVHWVVYDISPDVEKVEENTVPGVAGINSYKKDCYRGPCPPSGTHRYFFKLYALDGKLELGAGKNKEQVLERMTGHVIGQTELIGVYERI